MMPSMCTLRLYQNFAPDKASLSGVLPTSTVVLPGRRAGITHATMLDVFHVP
jgi:hypothetical protein